MNVEPKEVDKLTCSVDLCLVRIFALTEHRSCVQAISVGTCDQICHTQEDGCPVRKVHGCPLLLGAHGGINRLVYFRFP